MAYYQIIWDEEPGGNVEHIAEHDLTPSGGIAMAKERGKRIYRTTTDEERAKLAMVREQIAEELPDIRQRAKERLAVLKKEGMPLRQVLAALRAERERQGLSLADINERTGIDRAALSRLENNADANPTLATLERYAEAVGRRMVVLPSEPT
ncbi:MAG: helix-turn-helix transcriptional regulator [Pirellulaceae bacterium]|jgi:DNA-binding phage protein|nr:helix-turn-helix transcriptional regulator [Pirellulaceae bacterium]